MGFSGGSAGNESSHIVGDLGLIPGLGRSPGEGNSYPLQYSGLENSTDFIPHHIAENRTWLSDFHFHTNDKQSNKIKKTIPFIIPPKSIKYLGTECSK